MLTMDAHGNMVKTRRADLPELHIGMGGGAFDVYRVCEQMARIDLGVATGVLATFLGSDPIRVGASPDQKAHWMGRLAEEGLLMAYGATEPAAGSDLGALKTRAEPVQENGEITGYRITGAKQWISNGGFADLVTLFVRTPDHPREDGRPSISCLLVERCMGFESGKEEEKLGIRGSSTVPLLFEDVKVPVENLVGEAGDGFAQQ